VEVTQVPVPYSKLADFCKAHSIVRMWLFGSVLRADFSVASDVDVLVELDPAHIPGWEFYGNWREELESIMGRPVDLLTPDSLRPWIRQKIMATAQVIYDRD
jgi:hypothetical protein